MNQMFTLNISICLIFYMQKLLLILLYFLSCFTFSQPFWGFTSGEPEAKGGIRCFHRKRKMAVFQSVQWYCYYFSSSPYGADHKDLWIIFHWIVCSGIVKIWGCLQNQALEQLLEIAADISDIFQPISTILSTPSTTTKKL